MQYIKTLRSNYKVALLSNIARESYHEFIEPIKNNFDITVTSYQTQLAKPERAIYEYCAKELDVDVSECVMVDDSQANCEGAIAAGMQAILYEDLDSLKTKLKTLLNT